MRQPGHHTASGALGRCSEMNGYARLRGSEETEIVKALSQLALRDMPRWLTTRNSDITVHLHIYYETPGSIYIYGTLVNKILKTYNELFTSTFM